MHPPDEPLDEARRRERLARLLPPDPWHQVVTVLCLLACAGYILMGLSLLLGWTAPPAGERFMSPFWRGLGIIIIGIATGRYLLRQLSAR